MKQSPFKLLDAFTKKDHGSFFGRNEEIEELYERSFKSKLLLVYGASGTGKTSLVLCGLFSELSEDNFYPVYVRRQQDINESIIHTVASHAVTHITFEDLEPGVPEIIQRIEGLYYDTFKPIYLVIDQLEELLILGTESEKESFNSNLQAIVNSKLQCTTILIIREEYFAALSALEKTIPTLFDNRIRIERMRKKEVRQVIEKSCAQIRSIEIQEPDVFLEKVITYLSEDGLTVELTYLQVYLDKLYRDAKVINTIHVFNPQLVDATGGVKDVLGQFLEEQVAQLPNPELGWKILKVFITKSGTKRSVRITEVRSELENQGLSETLTSLEKYISQFVTSKILAELEESPDYFELSHDSLAFKTFEKLDAKERILLELQNLIELQYQNYLHRGILMSKADLAYIGGHLNQLRLNEEHRKFIALSKRFHKGRRWLLGSLVTVVILALSALSAVSIRNAQLAEESNELAISEKLKSDASLKIANVAEQKRDSIEINNMMETAEIYIKAGYNGNAKLILDSVLRIDTSARRNAIVKQFKTIHGL